MTFGSMDNAGCCPRSENGAAVCSAKELMVHVQHVLDTSMYSSALTLVRIALWFVVVRFLEGCQQEQF